MSESRKILCEVEDLVYEFGHDGFIHQISMRSFNGAQTDVVQNNFGRILIRLGDGRELSPFIPNDELPDFGTYLESKTVEFPYIGWKDADGVEQEDFRLALRYELWPGGKGFAFAFFYAKKNDPVDLDEFSLKFDLALSKFPDTTWGIRPRPESYNGANIQSLNLGRNLSRQNKHADGNIICSINANARQKDGQSAYFEINIEGQNSLSGNPNDNYSDFIWNESGDLSAEYGFIKEKPCKGQTLHPWQWRNQWSWVIKYADKKRHKPPFHMYHYLDNFQKYPSDECLEMIEKNGADVLIIHENWRFDIQNDGFPADAKKLRHVIEEAHKHNIRVALYMRGDEVSAVETACEWFDRYLKKDFDGFYMDYAGPFHPEAPTESYPGGRIEFHRYFLRMRSLRERIGKDGIFYGHSGTSFSGIGFVGGIIDGYVSGEGEGGIMVNSREDHEYFSMAPVCVATMWTGAFPAYSTEKMTPFLAAAGQYPHSPLGVQLKSSSLAHPQEPGLNDIAFRPLWKIWHCFRHERNILIYNDYNSTGVFADRDSSVGHYLMVSENGNKALLVVSNFKQEVVTKNVTVHFGMTAFNPTGKKCWKYFEEKAEEQTFDTTDVTCSFRLK